MASKFSVVHPRCMLPIDFDVDDGSTQLRLFHVPRIEMFHEKSIAVRAFE